MITGLPRKRLIRSCPLCDYDRGIILYNLEFKLFDDCPLPSSYDVITCEQCGFVFYDTLCTENDIADYYIKNSSYSNTLTTGAGGSTPLEQKRFASIVDYIEGFIADKDAVLFDIGCGQGGLLNELKKDGFTRLYGVDMIPACADYVSDAYKIPANTGSAVNIHFPETKADMLIYSHLLEHVYDLRQALAHARERLKKGGLVYVEVPDARKYGQYFITPFYYFFLEHLNHFDHFQMNRLFTSSGFSVVDYGEKIIEATADIEIPCIYFVFQKTGLQDTIHPQADFELAEVMIDYIDICKSRESHRTIEHLHETREGVCVWGLSQNTMRLLAQSPLGSCKIKCFIDNDKNKQNKTINGIPVLAPDKLNEATDKEAVVITVRNYENEIIDYLRSIQFAGKILTLD